MHSESNEMKLRASVSIFFPQIFYEWRLGKFKYYLSYAMVTGGYLVVILLVSVLKKDALMTPH